MKVDIWFCYFEFNSRADILFSNRGEKVSMGHYKEVEIGCINEKQSIWGPSLLLGRTSFSDMLEVVMSEPPFQDQPYNKVPGVIFCLKKEMCEIHRLQNA